MNPVERDDILTTAGEVLVLNDGQLTLGLAPYGIALIDATR